VGRKSLAKERREQIVRALNRCVSKYGLQNTTIKKIAQEAGVQPGILHHYFKDRDEIIEEMVKTIVDEVSAKYLEEIQRYQDPEKRFREGISFLFGPMMVNDEYAAFFSDCWAEAKRNPRIRESFKMLYERFRRGIIDLLVQSGKVSGLSTKEIEDVAAMIVAIQDGVSLQWDVDREHVCLKRMATVTEQMIELYLGEAVSARGK
jgi:TetR/AcrR family transcriptional repressor of bet genes